MATSKLRKTIGVIKDSTSISLARVTGSGSAADLQVAVVKATRHCDAPPNPRYVAEILSQTRYSRALVQACVAIIGRRLDRTKNWVVALKSLMLVQRLLSKGGTAFENDVFFTTRRGTRFLNMCDFRDSSSRNGWDYAAFVRAYALYLDEALEYKMQGGGEKERECCEEEDDEDDDGGNENAVVVRPTPAAEMENEAIFFSADRIMQLLDRFLACRPAGAAKHNRIVVVAIYPILKESFQIYHHITEILGALIDRFMQMEVSDMVQVHDIFCRVSKQYDDLYSFYNWCKTVGIMRFPDYPTVEKISQPKLQMMDDFIRQKSAVRKLTASPKLLPPPVVEQVVSDPEKSLPAPLVEEEKFVEEKKKTQEEGDLLNLYGDEPVTEDFGDKLALALFDGYPETASGGIPPWEAFKDSNSGDWETALVQSVSHLSNQKPSLPQGFDSLLLDSMYQHAAAPAVYDPFAASAGIAPPAYVQMSELEKKQNLLLQEQLLWQQYLRDGMQGQVGLERLQQQNYYQYNIPAGYAAAW